MLPICIDICISLPSNERVEVPRAQCEKRVVIIATSFILVVGNMRTDISTCQNMNANVDIDQM